MLTLISLLEHVRCRYYSDICLCSTIYKDISIKIISRHIVQPLLGSVVKRHVESPVPVHGAGDVVGEVVVGVLQGLV